MKDWEIIPDKGIEFNPYINGNRRDTPMEDRWFTINVTNALAPTDGTAASNTLYAATPDCEIPKCDPEFSKLFLTCVVALLLLHAYVSNKTI